jgi:hypothetical protein
MGFNKQKLQRNGSSVIRSMMKRLADDAKQLLEKKAVGTVPVETAKPHSKAALY